MLFYTGLFFLVIAVSLDGFGVGIAYGMRQIRIPLPALFVIMLCSGMVVLIAMTIGSTLTTFISIQTAKTIGGCILVCIGLFCFWNVVRTGSEKERPPTTKEEIQIKQFTSLLKEPDKADMDHSGVISIKEAFLLGFALALDAFGAGLSAAMLGYSPILTPILIAFMSGSLVFCGTRMGLFLAHNRWVKKLTLLPPFLLIALGIYNMF